MIKAMKKQNIGKILPGIALLLVYCESCLSLRFSDEMLKYLLAPISPIIYLDNVSNIWHHTLAHKVSLVMSVFRL